MNHTGTDVLILVASVAIIIRACVSLKYFITIRPDTEVNELRVYLAQQEREFLLFVVSQIVKRGETADSDIQHRVYVRALPPIIDQILETHSEPDMLEVGNDVLVEEIDEVVTYINNVKLHYL